MLSRVANSVYWMSRYLERADNVARFINVNVHLILDLNLKASNAQWAPLVTTSGDETDFTKRYKEASEKNVIRFLTFDEKNHNSILSCINYARENARTVRETIPSDMWEQINELYHLARKHSRKRSITDLQEFYDHVRTANHLFTGLLENVTSHGEAWHFARMGRMLERADKTARILDVKYFLLLPNSEYVDSPYDAVQWGAVLKSANAFEMYRKQFHRINYKDVAQFLIFDRYFPRSMLHCVNAAQKSLNAITNKEMTKLCEMLISSTVTQVLDNGLHEFIDIFQFNLNVVDGAIYQSFFAPQTA
jgi:uncharacterized alpha-E superfamily protein